jgi:hypothetical protein
MKVNGLMLKPIVRRQNGVPRLARPPRNLGFDLPVGLSQRNIEGIRANTYCQIVSRPGAILSTAGLVAAQWTSNAARPGSVCFYRFGEWREDHSRPRGAALAPNAGRSAWDHHPGWMTMESILPKKSAPPSPGGDEKHACSLLLVILTLLLCMRVPEHLFGLPQSRPPKNQTSEP